MERLLGYVAHRWKWLIVGAVVGGLLGGGSTVVRPDAWVADTLVVLTDATIPAEEFPAVAAAIFPTDAVLGSVITELGLDETPGSLISSGQLQIGTAPGGLTVRVVARTDDELLSVGLANAAAAALAEVGEANGFGEIAEFTAETARRESDPLASSAVVGALIGVAVAAALLTLRYVIGHRPATQEERAGADITVRVRVAPSREGDLKTADVTPMEVLAGLLRGYADGGPVTGLMLDDGPSGWAVMMVADALSDLAGRTEPAPVLTWTSASQPLTDSADRVVVVAPSGEGPRLDDVRRMLGGDRSGRLVALVAVSAPDVS